jgi:hypothetical protein
MKWSRFAVAIAVVCVACVKVPDSIKGTFAERQNGETDNFSPSAPHSVAPPDTVLTQAKLSIADASAPDASMLGAMKMPEGMCRDMSASSSSIPDASVVSATSNCLQDAGN